MDSTRAVGAGRSRGGFTIIEVIIAVVVLTSGVLGMAGTTAWVVRQVTLAQATSDRAAALQSSIERLRGYDFDSLAAGTDNIGPFSVSWTVTGAPPVRTVVVVTTGPGLVPVAGALPIMSNAVVDSFTYLVVHP